MLAIVATACEVCGSRDQDESMLLCDGCNKGHHTFCCEPPIEVVPEGDWYCDKCADTLGIDRSEQSQSDTTTTPGSSKVPKKKRRRISRWATGALSKKKKKKQSDDEGREGEASEKEGGRTRSPDKSPGEKRRLFEDEAVEGGPSSPVAGPSSSRPAEGLRSTRRSHQHEAAGPSTAPPTPPEHSRDLAPTNLRSGVVGAIILKLTSLFSFIGLRLLA